MLTPSAWRAVRLGALLAGLSPLAARAQTPGAVAVAPPAADQPALAAGFLNGNTLRSRVCASTSCTLTQGRDISVPEAADVTRATLAVVRLRRDRHAIHVSVPLRAGEGAWEAVLVAPLGGGDPGVVFADRTGLVEGQYGARSGNMVVVSPPDQEKTRSILVGRQLEEVTLCGRPTVLEQRWLDPADLHLKPAKYQRLPFDERARAPRLRATELPADEIPTAPGLLYGATASGSLKQHPPAALVDGDPSTAWAEARGGDGRGEFVALHVMDQPISGFEVTVRPSPADVPDGEAPQQFWLATRDQLFHVQLPDDAWDHPAARYAVALPEPVRTDCVALVLESFPPSPRGHQAMVAELVARSAFSDSSIEQLVAKLPGGGPEAEQAGSVLRSRGEPAFVAVAGAFAELDEGGRRVALDVIDAAPCPIRAAVYAEALRGPVPAQHIHAQARLRDCGEAAADALLDALETAPPEAVGRLADQLTEVAPELAVQRLVPRLAKASARERRVLRVALGRAARSPHVRDAVTSMLLETGLDERAAVDLLRALGPQLEPLAAPASSALSRLAKPTASFRTRFLLLESAGQLAPSSSPAVEFLRRSLGDDPDWRIRSHAAAAVQDPKPVQDLLLAALNDSSVRVRIAAIQTLARTPDVPSTSHLAELLRRDHWPIARAEAAKALGGLGPSGDVDRALLAAVRDSSRHVRAPVLLALGERRVAAAGKPARKRLVDDREDTNVRIAAAVALGKLCDPAAVEPLTRIARRMADPHDLSEERQVAPAAVTALGRLRPRDLEARLAPLLAEGAPPVARAAARAALANAGSCER